MVFTTQLGGCVKSGQHVTGVFFPSQLYSHEGLLLASLHARGVAEQYADDGNAFRSKSQQSVWSATYPSGRAHPAIGTDAFPKPSPSASWYQSGLLVHELLTQQPLGHETVLHAQFPATQVVP
jgi:hypothetical protein